MGTEMEMETRDIEISEVTAESAPSSPDLPSQIPSIAPPKSNSTEPPTPPTPQTASAASVFKNLLIMEQTLEQEYVAQTSLKRKFTVFFCSMLWLASFLFYMLFIVNWGVTPHNKLHNSLSSSQFRPPSYYRRLMMKLLMLLCLISLALFYLSGEYYKTIVYPRKYLAYTNKGLRQLNVKLVKTKGLSEAYLPESAINHPKFGLLRQKLNNFCYLLAVHVSVHILWKIFYVSKKDKLNSYVTRDFLPGGETVKISLFSWKFSTDLRESWEFYRTEFWYFENLRRQRLFYSVWNRKKQERFSKKGTEEIGKGEIKRKERKSTERKRRSTTVRRKHRESDAMAQSELPGLREKGKHRKKQEFGLRG